MRIIPAIDIIDGKCVRLSKGDYNTKKVYNENPLEVAKEFEANGIKFLHLVDLDGAKSSKIINSRILSDIASKTSLKIDFGGGIKTNEDIKIAFDNGANQITAGSIAVKNPKMVLNWKEEYGADKIIIGADSNKGKIAINGWQEESKLEVESFIKKYLDIGFTFFIPTDIQKDGMLQGPSIELYKKILEMKSIKLIASGGVSCVEDLISLKEIGCEGAIVGKAFYEGRISIKELSKLS